MDQKSPDERVGGKAHHLFAVTILALIVLPTECHHLVA
jgi:hypothetical protein